MELGSLDVVASKVMKKTSQVSGNWLVKLGMSLGQVRVCLYRKFMACQLQHNRKSLLRRNQMILLRCNHFLIVSILFLFHWPFEWTKSESRWRNYGHNDKASFKDNTQTWYHNSILFIHLILLWAFHTKLFNNKFIFCLSISPYLSCN